MKSADEIAARMRHEDWLIDAIRDAAPKEFDRRQIDRISFGATTFEIRKQRIRACICDAGIAGKVAGGKKKNNPETFAAVFQRFYSEPLNP